MAEGLCQHLVAVRGFLEQLGDTPAVAQVAQAQRVHVEQVLETTPLTVTDAEKALHLPHSERVEDIAHFRDAFGRPENLEYAVFFFRVGVCVGIASSVVIPFLLIAFLFCNMCACARFVLCEVARLSCLVWWTDKDGEGRNG